MDSNKRIKVISLYKYVNKPDIMTADNLETDVCCFFRYSCRACRWWE